MKRSSFLRVKFLWSHMCAASAWKRIWELLASKNTEIFSISVVEVLYQLPGPTVVMSFVTVEPGKENFIPAVIYYFSTWSYS